MSKIGTIKLMAGAFTTVIGATIYGYELKNIIVDKNGNSKHVTILIGSVMATMIGASLLGSGINDTCAGIELDICKKLADGTLSIEGAEDAIKITQLVTKVK